MLANTPHTLPLNLYMDYCVGNKVYLRTDMLEILAMNARFAQHKPHMVHSAATNSITTF